MGLTNHLKQHRARLNLTQEELGRRVGVRRQTILAIEKQHYVPSTLLAFKIARELRMRVDELFELDDERLPPRVSSSRRRRSPTPARKVH